MKRALAVVVLLALAGCAAGSVVNSRCTGECTKLYYTDGNSGISEQFFYIHRYVDTEAAVVCYITYIGSGSGGISCLPLAQTELAP